MGIVIYEHPFSPYAQKCKIILSEKGVPFESAMASAASNAARPLIEVNPRAEVPALIDDGFTIYDSSIIIAYLEEKYPDPPMLPVTPQERARVRMIEEIMDTQYEAINWAMSELTSFKRAEGEEAETLRTRARGQYAGLYGWLTRELGQRPYFNGDSFGFGDICVIPFINGTGRHDMAPEPASALGQWRERCNARPSLQACNAAIAAIMNSPTASLGAAAEAVKAGLMKREYRDHRVEWMLRSGGERIVWDGMKAGNIRFSHEMK